MLFDSHAHLNDRSYTEAEREALIRAIEDSNVSYVVDVGYDLASSALAAEHAARYPWCCAAVGIHPLYLAESDEGYTVGLNEVKDIALRGEANIAPAGARTGVAGTDAAGNAILNEVRESCLAMKELERLARSPGVKAIGEIGLDAPKWTVRQEIWFREQIRLALSLGMPLIIHSRHSYEEVLRILTDEGVFAPERKRLFPENPHTGTPDARVLFHAFSGSAEQAREVLRLGATISLAGTVTYKNNRKAALVAAEVPLEQLLIETDAPYLTPEPFRGERNISPYIEYTARKIAEIKSVSYEELAAVTTENSKRFFG